MLENSFSLLCVCLYVAALLVTAVYFLRNVLRAELWLRAYSGSTLEADGQSRFLLPSEAVLTPL